MTVVTLNIKQLQLGGWGKGAGKQSIYFICSSNPTPLVCICHHTTKFPGLQSMKLKQNNQLLKIQKVNTLLSGRRVALPTVLDREASDPKQIKGKNILGPCAVTAAQSQQAMAGFHQRIEFSSRHTACFEASFPFYNTSKEGCKSQGRRILKDSPGTQLWTILHTTPSKLRWLKISKHSTDLKIVAFYICFTYRIYVLYIF